MSEPQYEGDPGAGEWQDDGLAAQQPVQPEQFAEGPYYEQPQPYVDPQALAAQVGEFARQAGRQAAADLLRGPVGQMNAAEERRRERETAKLVEAAVDLANAKDPSLARIVESDEFSKYLEDSHGMARLDDTSPKALADSLLRESERFAWEQERQAKIARAAEGKEHFERVRRSVDGKFRLGGSPADDSAKFSLSDLERILGK